MIPDHITVTTEHRGPTTQHTVTITATGELFGRTAFGLTHESNEDLAHLLRTAAHPHNAP